MNIGMLSGKGKDVPECVYEFAFPTVNSYMRPGNKPLFRGSIKNHNPRKGTETVLLLSLHHSICLLLKIIIPVGGRNNIFLYERRMSMSYVYLTEENVKLQKKGGRYLVGRSLEIVMEIQE